jgi:YHYH protein
MKTKLALAHLVLAVMLGGLIIECALAQVTGTNRVSITIEGDQRVIRANGLPNHAPGAFPNQGNPNSMAPQNYTYRVPLHPQTAPAPRPFGLQPFGIALNGVVFDPGANEFWNGDRNSGWQYEAMNVPGKLGMDQNNAHVQPDGAYHYHGIPQGILAATKNVKEHMTQIGWAADGFPIYAPYGYSDANKTNSAVKEMKSSYRIKTGTRPNGPGGVYDGSFTADYDYVAGAGDLDECNGRTGITPEFPQGTYYYCVTADFPYIPRQYRGTPDPSFERRGPPPGGRDGRNGRGPRRGPPGGPPGGPGFGPPNRGGG